MGHIQTFYTNQTKKGTRGSLAQKRTTKTRNATREGCWKTYKNGRSKKIRNKIITKHEFTMLQTSKWMNLWKRKNLAKRKVKLNKNKNFKQNQKHTKLAPYTINMNTNPKKETKDSEKK